MKLTNDTKQVRRSGDFPETTFKIAANAKAFDILSSKLYRDTKLAIVRELSTNAWDAQVEAGNQDRQFLVHLPNDTAPVFSIRDYGTGLSPENVETIYTTYFSSTRNDSNDFVGALGLGSKSPFSYTDQFTVTSYWNGTAYSYSAFKNENGEPSIALLSDEPTKEENGVEIRMNVRREDMRAFADAAQKVYRFFPVRPQITGWKIVFPEHKPLFKGQGYEVYDTSETHADLDERINVVMGNICYPFEYSEFSNLFGYNARVVLFMGIGECDVAASREELHNSKNTIANVQKRANEAADEVQKLIEKDLTQYTSVVDRLIAQIRYQGLVNLQYKSVTIPTEVAGEYKLLSLESNGKKLFINKDWRSVLQPKAYTKYAIIEDDTTDDLKQSHKSKLRHFIDGKQGSRFYLATIQDRQKFKEVFGDPIAVLSKLPDPPKSARTVSSAQRTYVKMLTARRLNYSVQSQQWENVHGEVDITNAIAVPRKGYAAHWDGVGIENRYLVAMATQMGYDKVYGIPHAYYERMREELGLPDLFEEAKEYAQNYVDNMDKYRASRWIHNIYAHNSLSGIVSWIGGLSKACDDLIQVFKSKDVEDTVKFMINLFKIEKPKVPDYAEVFMAKYPLINSINFYHVQKQDITEYITLKEKQHV